MNTQDEYKLLERYEHLPDEAKKVLASGIFVKMQGRKFVLVKRRDLSGHPWMMLEKKE